MGQPSGVAYTRNAWPSEVARKHHQRIIVFSLATNELVVRNLLEAPSVLLEAYKRIVSVGAFIRSRAACVTKISTRSPRSSIAKRIPLMVKYGGYAIGVRREPSVIASA
jgi:hypothetical protein